MLMMLAVPLLAGCDAKPGPFRQVDGGWRYQDTPIPEADARTFVALDDHYAKDRSRVYHADTFRDGKEYFLIAHHRVAAVDGADPATFAALGRGYAKDAANVYFEGARVPVRDPRTFELLEHGFARDRVTGYYLHGEVTGSDGATFAVLAFDYAKNSTEVYYRGAVIPGADAATFSTFDAPTEAGDARDAKRTYAQGRPVQVR